MAVNSLPDSVWLFYFSGKPVGAADEVAAFSQNIFQRTLSDEEYVRLVDAIRGCILPEKGGEAMLMLRVKEVAQEKNFSMNLLSHRSEVAYNTIKAIYRDPLRETTTTTINKIARALGVPATQLLEDYEPS